MSLRSLLEKGTVFRSSENHETEFNDIKSALTSADIILSHPRFDLELEIHTDPHWLEILTVF